MTGSRGRDYDWAFDLRAFNSFSDDSEDDTLPPYPNQQQHEALLEDFDLASREESASYKPNPFSIAKINAAYRSARNRGSEAKRVLPKKSQPGKACRVAQTKIDDILKIQDPKYSKKAIVTRDHSLPGLGSSETIITGTKQPQKIGPTDHAFVQLQNVEDANAKPSSVSSVYYGFNLPLEPSLFSENAHILTQAPSHAAVGGEPASKLPSPPALNDGYVKHEVADPKLICDLSPSRSPLRSTVSKTVARSALPKHESPLPTPLRVPPFVEICPIDYFAGSNLDQIDEKCYPDNRVKQGSFT
jgi:hypothetical protein